MPSTDRVRGAGTVSRSRRANLPQLYQEVFTAIVRLRANPHSVTNAETFRAQFRAALSGAEESATRRGYSPDDGRLATFATVAFLDESVLNAASPTMLEWVRKPLQSEMFGVHVAGEIFFRNLDRLLERTDSPELADLLEVFALCLRLGFRGRFSAGGTGELRAYAERTEEKIRRIRGASMPAPAGAESEPRWKAADPWYRRLLWVAAAACGAAVVLFVLFTVLLRVGSGELLRLAEGVSL